MKMCYASQTEPDQTQFKDLISAHNKHNHTVHTRVYIKYTYLMRRSNEVVVFIPVFKFS